MSVQPKLSRAELDSELDALAQWMPDVLSDTDEAHQMDAFAGRADEIEARVTPDDHDHFWSRVQCILRDNGLVPGDDEPCGESGSNVR